MIPRESEHQFFQHNTLCMFMNMWQYTDDLDDLSMLRAFSFLRIIKLSSKKLPDETIKHKETSNNT